jgi:TAG lipase/steryl ester hydrolase/phospholipase A2/LPA acyltransferase
MLTDMTFLEAFHRTKRLLNVTVTPADTNEPPRVLNHLTAPHVVIWSAVAASSAFPGLFPPQSILARDPDGNFVGYAMCLVADDALHFMITIQALLF